MDSLQSRLQDDLSAARKLQDKLRILVLSTTVSEVKNRRIELRRELLDEEVIEVLRKGIKKRRESAELYSKAGRDDLASKESAEIDMLDVYLPALASEAEIRAAVVNAITQGATTMGPLMGAVVPRFRGKADGTLINSIAREELARLG